MTKKILIVDDDSEDLIAIKSLLETQKYKTITAVNGAEALDILKKNKLDLILIDILMPVLSGYDLLRLLREKLNHKVKMIYITILPKQDINLTDVDGVVQKPFSPESLLKEVKRVLKER